MNTDRRTRRRRVQVVEDGRDVADGRRDIPSIGRPTRRGGDRAAAVTKAYDAFAPTADVLDVALPVADGTEPMQDAGKIPVAATNELVVGRHPLVDSAVTLGMPQWESCL